jgi:CubicO group peptidase (beta-lactamase class C family)
VQLRLDSKLIGTRRQFLAAGSIGAAASAVPFAAQAALAKPCPKGKPNWIPSEEFLDWLPKVMDFFYVPGVSMAVVDKEAIVWSDVRGVANEKTRKALTTENTFEAASMGKPIFAYVVMKLVDEGLIDLDRRLVEYRRPDYLGNDPNLDLITVRDALRHSTGLPNWHTDSKEGLKTEFKPGTRFQYSGEGFFWLQLIVEKLTGQGLDTVMRTRLFEPMGLSKSTYAWDAIQERWAVDGSDVPSSGPSDDAGEVPFQFSREIANIRLRIGEKWGKPYSTWTYDDVERAVPETQELIKASGMFPVDVANASAERFKLPSHVGPNAASTLRTTPTEYAKLMTLMLPRAKRAPWEISEASRQAMLTPQIQVKAGNTLLSAGLGWAVEHQPASELLLFRHGGDNQNFKSFGVSDARERAFVVFTNGEDGDKLTPVVSRAATRLDLIWR